MKPINSKRGITLMELMVVIAIMGVLSTVAVPKLFGAGEKAREKIDLMKLYDLRNAINLALIEDTDAMTNYSPAKNQSTDYKNTLRSKLENGLNSDRGATLFVIELHNGLSINVQGSHHKANNTHNICEMVGTSGTWYSALRDARFEGVADIIAARLKGGNNYKSDGETFTSIEYTNADGNTDYRTAPKNRMFLSKALNIGKINDNVRYTLSVRWSNPKDPGYSVEVYMLPNGHSWNDAYLSDHGTCFSTYGNKGCSKKKK
jgi:prepilin-type N-terminal cleavage/methylation domain-containing protein